VDITWMTKNELKNKAMFALDQDQVDLIYVDYEFKHPRLWRSLADLIDLKFKTQTDPSWRMGSVGENENNFLPIEGASQAIYYNKELFEKAGIVLPHEKPMTEEDFLTIIRTLRAKGITPIGEGVADRDWKAGIPIMNAIFRFAGPDKVAKLLNGEINFSDSDVIKGLTFWKQVIDSGGYDPQKAFTLSLSEGIYEVTDGKAAISFCGTWINSKFGGTHRDRGQLGVLDWFTVANGKGNDFYEMTWPAGYGINKHGKRIAEAKKFLKFLMTPLAASLWMKNVQSPYPIASNEASEASLYRALARQRENKRPVIREFSVPSFASKAADNMWKVAVREFIMGRSSVEQFVKRMDKRM